MKRRNISNVCQPVHAGFLLLFAIISFSVPAVAQTATDPYSVNGVPVDETAASAQAARTTALANGQKKAFDILLRRLTLSADHSRLPAIPAGQIVNYVRDFSVDEKSSDVRYIAQMDVRFRSADVRSLLRNYSIPFAETVARPLVILPVYEAAGDLKLWEEPNPWRAAWQRVVVNEGLSPMVMPLGDLPDLSALTASQAVNGDADRIATITSRYAANGALVATASVKDSTAGTVEVYASAFGRGATDTVFSNSFRPADGETPEAVMDRARDWLRTAVDDAWKDRNLIRFGQEAVVLVRVPIRSLSDWNDIRRRLDDIAIIYKRELLSLALDRAMVDLYFTGDADQLRSALAQKDLVLEAELGQWVLRQL
ncbi:MAG: DUF2066 domain-containing protein [Rhodospirillales bacterium]